MRATRLFAIGDIRCVDVPMPTLTPGDLLIHVEAAGICGTDRHLYKGEFPCVPGTTLGHEFSGIVVDAGGSDIPEGARVTCDPNAWCGICEPCRRGRVNLCENNTATGIGRDGGFAEYCAFPAAKAHILPSDLDPLYGAFCEPLACSLHGMDMGAVVPGERVMVIGGGVIGLFAVQLAKRAGAEVMLLTRHAAKQALGQRLGADYVATTQEAAQAQWSDGADLVVECAGVAETVRMAPALTRVGGRVVVLGVLPRGAQVEIEPFDLLFREIQIHFSFLNPFTHDRASQMIAQGSIEIAPLLSRKLSLEEAAHAIATPAIDGDVRAIVLPDMFDNR